MYVVTCQASTIQGMTPRDEIQKQKFILVSLSLTILEDNIRNYRIYTQIAIVLSELAVYLSSCLSVLRLTVILRWFTVPSHCGYLFWSLWLLSHPSCLTVAWLPP